MKFADAYCAIIVSAQTYFQYPQRDPAATELFGVLIVSSGKDSHRAHC